ncbi:MAG: flagellar M-ring protein FliF [Acidobacteria bacterium]|nr:flagellar M-ring protein FliF [Acidobacteriota bacterium]
MEQLKGLFSNLSLRQRIQIVLVAILVGAGLYAFSRWQHDRDFKALYTALSAEDAGAMVRRLKESGVEYRLSDNGTSVLVASEKVAEARLEMAGAGLPKSGRIGFELFDKTNFGMTDFTEHVNYRRAVEGELERSVMSLSEVEGARVHVTFSKDSVFLESQQPAKASVLLKLRPGAKLAPQNVQAITNLLASAVEGLSPDSVAVLDMRGNLLNRPKRNGLRNAAEPADEQLDYEQKIEKALLAKITTTLEPLFGPEKFRAVVSAECDFSSGELSEESFDPSKSVMVTSQRTEDAASSHTAAGVPGTASALPRPAAKGNGAGGTGRTTENLTFQTSRTVRQTRLPVGAIKRLSVSVLLDQAGRPGTDRNPAAPLSPETIKVVKDVITVAVGFNPARGDQLVVESLPFESPSDQERVETPKAAPRPISKLPAPVARLIGNPNNLWMLGAALTVLTLVARVASKILLRSKARKTAAAARPAVAAAPGAQLEAPAATPRLAGPGKVEVLLLQARGLTGNDAVHSAAALREWIEQKA